MQSPLCRGYISDRWGSGQFFDALFDECGTSGQDRGAEDPAKSDEGDGTTADNNVREPVSACDEAGHTQEDGVDNGGNGKSFFCQDRKKGAKE